MLRVKVRVDVGTAVDGGTGLLIKMQDNVLRNRLQRGEHQHIPRLVCRESAHLHVIFVLIDAVAPS